MDGALGGAAGLLEDDELLARKRGVQRPAPPDEAYLVRARNLIELAIRRRWATGMLTRDEDGVFSAFLGAEHIERLLLQPLAAEPACPPEPVFARGTPLGMLIERMDLSPSRADLLAVLLAYETDPVAARLVTYLGGNQSQFELTLDLLFEIVYRSRGLTAGATAALLQRDLSPQHALQRLRYLLIEEDAGRSGLARRVRLAGHVTEYLLGDDSLDCELGGAARLHPPLEPTLPCGAAQVEAVRAVLAARGRLLVLDGPALAGQEAVFACAAARLGMPHLLVSGRDLGPERLVLAFREASLRGALLAFTSGEDALAGEALRRFQDCLGAFPGTVTLIHPGGALRRLSILRPVHAVTLGPLAPEERMQLWQHHLGAASALSPAVLEETSALLHLGSAGIVNACGLAREAAAVEGVQVGRRHVMQGMRQLFDSELSAVARRVEVSQRWRDLVLPEEVGQSIQAALACIRHRSEVLGTWGFGRKLGKGLGLNMLFSGEPGTGKSMVAGLIAREFELDLYVVDLSRLTSKWLGETEKNLARAFDAAEVGHVLLLFDEADSVLGKRSAEIRSSNDRHANLETNFILARLEQFQGMAVFTSNLASAIDPAVERRMTVHVRFPFPDEETRAELWRRMIPEEAPLAADIDYGYLAGRFEIAGGFIRNIVLRAAYMAVQENAAICMDHLCAASELEYCERGFLFPGGRLT